MIQYDDENPDCVRTYSTLKIFTGSISPDELTNSFQQTPTRAWYTDGEGPGRGKPVNAWYLTTKGQVQSRDTSRHLAYLLDFLHSHKDYVDSFAQKGIRLEIINFWHSAGKGGPTCHPQHMKQLAHWDIPISWNIYFGD